MFHNLQDFTSPFLPFSALSSPSFLQLPLLVFIYTLKTTAVFVGEEDWICYLLCRCHLLLPPFNGVLKCRLKGDLGLYLFSPFSFPFLFCHRFLYVCVRGQRALKHDRVCVDLFFFFSSSSFSSLSDWWMNGSGGGEIRKGQKDPGKVNQPACKCKWGKGKTVRSDTKTWKCFEDRFHQSWRWGL